MNAIETRTETKNEKTPFSRWNINRVSKQTFDENPKVKIAGKFIDLREYTNANAEDTKIYDVMEKYNGDLKMTAEKLNNHYIAIDEELSKINTLQDAHERINQGTKVWNELPEKVRAKFNYSMKDFIVNGAKFAQGEIKKYNDMIAAEKAKWEAENKPTIKPTIEQKPQTNITTGE